MALNRSPGLILNDLFVLFVMGFNVTFNTSRCPTVMVEEDLSACMSSYSAYRH